VAKMNEMGIYTNGYGNKMYIYSIGSNYIVYDEYWDEVRIFEDPISSTNYITRHGYTE
jgi:hypothetical protein